MITKIKTRSNGHLPHASSICSELFEVDNVNLLSGNPTVSNSGNVRQVPFANVKESEDDFIIEMAVPGISQKEIEIDMQGRTLNISVDKHDNLRENQRYTKMEFDYHCFERSFILPEWVNTNEIRAVYDCGMVYVLIPKTEAARKQPKKRVELMKALVESDE